jgi:hypothetical protein
MSRTRRRICLQEGLHLDLNWLARNRFIEKGIRSPERGVRWTHPDCGDVAVGVVRADMRDFDAGWLHVRIRGFSQVITLVGLPRHFGGRQWYFVCPVTGRPASIVWKPPGADQFCARYAWGDKVAYLSQFGNWIDRAHLGKARMNAKLAGQSNPDAQTCLPRPKRMRVASYNHIVTRFDAYQSKLDNGLKAMISRLARDH